MKAVKVSELAFADDLVLMASTKNNLQQNVNLWEKELEKRNMIISVNKTKTMIISRETQNHTIKLATEALEQVTFFKYLGEPTGMMGK